MLPHALYGPLHPQYTVGDSVGSDVVVSSSDDDDDFPDDNNLTLVNSTISNNAVTFISNIFS
jgi:hypothetical protein